MKICGKQAKRNFIENIFNLNCFGIMFADIKSDINSLKKELTYINNEIIKSSQRLEQLTGKFEDFNNQLNTEIDSLKNEMVNKYNELKRIKETIIELTNNLINYEELTAEYNSITINLKKLNKALNKLEKEILEIQYNIKSKENTLSEINKLQSGLCETCTELFKSRYGYLEKTEEINSLNNDLTAKNIQLTKLNDAITKLETDENKLTNTLNVLNTKYKEKETLEYKVQMLTSDIKKLKVEYDKLTSDTSNPFKELMDKTQQELNTLKTQLITYVKDIKHLEILRDACSETGVKRFIIKDIVKLLNSLIQKYLNEIGAEYLVYFDESFDFKFITMNGECEFSNFSTRRTSTNTNCNNFSI